MKSVLTIVLVSFLVSGCASGKNNLLDTKGKPVRSLTDKAFIAGSMDDNVQKCFDASIAKFNADQAEAERDTRRNSSPGIDDTTMGTNATALAMVDRVLDYAEKLDENRTRIELAKLGVPFTTSGLPDCAKLGYSHMLIEKKKINHATLNNLGGKAFGLLKVFGITYAGAKVALDIADKLAEPKITSGDGSTNILGDDNVYQPDNRTNPCIEDGSCVTPAEEEMMEEGGEMAEEVVSESTEDPTEVGELPVE